MAATNGRMWFVGIVVTIVAAIGGMSFAIIDYHNGDLAVVERSVDGLRDRHDLDCKEVQAQSRNRLDKAVDKLVSEQRFTAEMRAIQFQFTTLQTQLTAQKEDLDKRLERIERAVNRRRGR